MKICVYGLVQNIGSRAAEWIYHLQSADLILLGDIGSTDNSREILKNLGAKVYDLSIDPWRYDVARNTLLSLIPQDIDIAVVCDFNQQLSPNWRTVLLQNWLPETTKITCQHRCVTGEYTSVEKIHTPQGMYWQRPVYETLSPSSSEQIVSVKDLIITDQFDYKFGNWHSLLVESVKENPNDGEMIFRLAHSLATMAHWTEAIDMHKRNITNGTCSLYKSHSMIHLSGLEHHRLPYWLANAVVECPWRRETWHELANYYYRQHEWHLCLSHAVKALTLGCTLPITELEETRLLIQLNDMASMSAWNCNMLDTSLKYAEAAVKLDPTDGRLQNNLAIIKNIITNSTQHGGLA